MVRTFIKHVVGVDASYKGLYSKTRAYYGTVEQQGCLTLYLHLLLWITSSLNPQEIRDRIMKHDSDFISVLIAYLESSYVREFETRSSSNINQQIILDKTKPQYVNPMLTMLLPLPPNVCTCSGIWACKLAWLL